MTFYALGDISMSSLSGNRITVAQAARELGLSVATVRYWMETGKLDIGIYLKKKGGKRAMYVVLRDKLDTVLGKGPVG